MNKTELINQIAITLSITKAEAKRIVEATTTVITKALVNGDKVNLTGFGNFYVGKREARIGRNPRTGATIRIKSTNSAKFKAGSLLKNQLNERRARVKETVYAGGDISFSRSSRLRDSESGMMEWKTDERIGTIERKKQGKKDKGGSDNTGPKVKLKK